MRTKEELQKIASAVKEKMNLSKDEEEVFLISADYASITNLMDYTTEEVRHLIYEDLKEEFNK